MHFFARRLFRPAMMASFLVLLVGVASAQGDSGKTGELPLWLSGNLYHAELVANERLTRALGAGRGQLQGQHFRGELRDVADSWLRLSRVSGRWQGVVSLFGELHVVAGAADGSALSPRPLARALNALAETPGCGAAPHASALEEGDTSTSVFTAPTVEAATLSELCDTTVDGVCLVPELEMVFDHHFQSDFSSDWEDQAATLLNIVEGYYRQDLNLAFDALSMTFPDSELFNNSTDAFVFLGDPADDTDPDGIADKKNNLPFLQNPQAIFHVVTGRDFVSADGSSGVVGLAYTDALCDNNGYSSGTSQVLNGDIALTAVVVAHEIGHNMGAIHDGEQEEGRGINNTCDPDTFIMASSISQSTPPDRFSSCSILEINGEIEDLSQGETPYRLEQCFKYPVDVAVAESSSNPAQVDDSTGATLDLYYDVSYQQAYGSATGIDAAGSIDARDGILVEAVMGGRACTLSPDALGYSCSGSAASQTLRVRVTVTGDQLRLQHRVDATGGNVIDMVETNNAVSTSLPANVMAPPTGLVLTELEDSIRLDWQDNADDEIGYRVERQRPGDTDWTLLAGLPADSTGYRDDSVEAGVLYRFRVLAEKSGGGVSDPSNIVEGGVDLVTSAPSSGDSGSSGGAFPGLLFWLPLLLVYRNGRDAAKMPAVTVAAALMLSGCNATAEPPREKPEVVEPEGTLTLQGARERWADAQLDSYRYVLRQKCYCPREALRPVVVTVRDGQVRDLVMAEGEGEVPDGIRENARTIPAWFDYIEDWQKRSPARLEVSYQRDSGYPSQILVDRHSRMADDEFSWHLSDLAPVPGEGEKDDGEMPAENPAPGEAPGT